MSNTLQETLQNLRTWLEAEENYENSAEHGLNALYALEEVTKLAQEWAGSSDGLEAGRGFTVLDTITKALEA